MELTGNKGEWSEVYVLFKLLSDLKLFSADENLSRTNSFLNVIHILRSDINDYKYLPSGTNIIVIDTGTNKKILSVSKTHLQLLSRKLFAEIKKGKGSSFSIDPGLLKKLQKLSISKLKEGSSSKTDINVFVSDPLNGIKSLKKFSIKSFIGSDPTLFNANKTTNIIYEVKDASNNPMSPSDISTINSIKTSHKYLDRVKQIQQLGYKIIYTDYEDETFKLNLELIDSKMPEIIACAVLEKYVSRKSKMIDVIDNLNTLNPLGYNMSKGHNFYEYRIINFLVEVALGMTSTNVWKGIHDATGGIIIVKNMGEVLCYHLIDFNKFKSYLKNNSKLDNPSGSRMGYGEVYIQGNQTYLKLNFQVKA